jgi:riboflavin kinase/FMN adenylyltransferase
MQIHFWGKVQRGDGRGKKLGFPTANVALHKQLEEGVYISKVSIKNVILNESEESHSINRDPSTSLRSAQDDNLKLPSLTFIGSAKTFNKTDYKSETYILDFDKDIYGEYLSITLIKKLRGNKKFTSGEDLVRQMRLDEKEAREYFANSH